MSERRRSGFPENWLEYAILVLSFGLLLSYISPLFVTDSLQLVFFQIAGSMIIVLSLLFGTVILLFGMMIWVDRHELAKKINRTLESVNVEDIVIQHGRPAYLLANSFDRELLVTISQVGGDLPNTELILKDEAFLKTRKELVTSVTKLITLGLLSPPSKFPLYRVFLTTRGLDALNAPASLFVSNMPEEVWQYVFQMKLSMWNGEWSGAAISMANSLQLMLIRRIEDVKSKDIEAWDSIIESLDDKWKEIVKKALIKWQLGDLLYILRQLGEVRQETFPYYLISELISMRNKVHPPEEGIKPHPFLPRDIALMDLYLDILLQIWYGRE